MYQLENYLGHWATPFWGGVGFVGGLIFSLLIIWSLVWKGIALWKAARVGSKPWFVAFLILNTLGILEILYIYVFSKKSKTSQK
jgi:hypothetical protein